MNKYRLFIVVCLSLLLWQGVQAQRIHEILFCNTIDRSIGKSVEIDNDRALDEIGCIGGYIGYEVVEHVYQGKDCTRKNLIKLLETLDCSNKDIIFFYYSGHGVHANTNFEDKLPQMCMNTNIESQFVPVHLVDEMLAKKGPKLRIIMTDCCNSIDQSGIVQAKDGLAMERGVTVIKSTHQANYRKLFTEPSGSVIVTSSKLGQSSIGNTLYGGCFSYAFWDLLLKECSSTTGTPTWNDLMKKVQETTVNIASRYNHPQEPYYVVNLNGNNSSSTNAPSYTTPNTTEPAEPAPDGFGQAINQLLAVSDMGKRAKTASDIRRKCFPDGQEATVITVGRNLKTVVDYEDIDTYLDRLSSNKKIARINVIKDKTDTKGKRFFTVTEMRNE